MTDPETEEEQGLTFLYETMQAGLKAQIAGAFWNGFIIGAFVAVIIFFLFLAVT